MATSKNPAVQGVLKSKGYSDTKKPPYKTAAQRETAAQGKAASDAKRAQDIGKMNNTTRKKAGEIALPKQSSDPRATSSTKAGAIKQAQDMNKWKREQAVRSGKQYDAARAKVRGK